MVRSFFGLGIAAIGCSVAWGASAQDAPAAPSTTITATVSVTVSPADALGSPVVVVDAPTVAPSAPVAPPAAAPPPAPSPIVPIPIEPVMPMVPPGYVLVVPQLQPQPQAYATPMFSTPPPQIDAPRTRSRFGRIMAEAGLGFAGMAAGALTGMAFGVGTCGDDDFDDDCSGVVAGGAILGAGVGTPLGIFLAGKMVDGNGGLGWTTLGTSAGFLLGAALVSGSDGNEYAVWMFFMAPVIGGILGYELSSDPSARAAEQARAAGVQLRASVGPTRGGAAVGLSGTF